MKRVIKSSFGYRDSDWVDPEDAGMYILEDEIRVDIDITVNPSDPDEIFNQVEKTTSNLDNENHEFGFEIASKEEIQEIAAEHVMYELQGESNVLQRVRGYVLIPYEFEGNEDTLEYDPSSIFVRSAFIKSSLSIKRV